MKKALSEKGYREPKGDNCNKFSKYFDKDNGCRRWCADFVSWAYDYTGNRDKKVPWGNPASVDAIAEWASKKPKKFVTVPQRGDIFLMRQDGNSHAGLVTEVSNEGHIHTIEGNTSRPDKPGSGGIWVWEKWHWIQTNEIEFVRVPEPI